MDLQKKIKQFPNAPGVYQMKDAAGHILYVGKAKDLRKRVASYWTKQARDRYQVEFLLRKVTDVDCVVTDNEKEALILENTLIKKYHPKYNIQLRDDKSYPSIKLSIRDRYPRIYVTRQIGKDNNLYYGPYSSALACREVVDFIEQYFQLRTCSDHELAGRKRPCLQYQIGRCSAPCVGLIDEATYASLVDEVRLLLEGQSRPLKKKIREHMEEASDELRFEDAARYRDLLHDLDRTLERQKVITHHDEDRDCIGLYREGEPGMVAILMIREGKVIGTRWFPFKKLVEDSEVLESFLTQFYGSSAYVPTEICLQTDLPNLNLIKEVLTEHRGASVSILVPQRGKKKDLVALAIRNAEEAFRRQGQKEADTEETLQILQRKLKLQRLPRRMECFDISNIQGKQAVGSMVCFAEGKPDKNYYRRFKIKTLPEKPNDYAMMYEVLSRRLAHKEKEAKWALPDLLVIDGGKGQLATALKVLEELDVLNVDVCALAKARPDEDGDKVFLPGRKNPVRFPRNSSALHLLMRLRDEAHRFAITYHKKLRQKGVRRSRLDAIPGVGAARKKDLLRYFGSLKRLSAASREDLQKMPGLPAALAERIWQALHPKSS